MIRDETTKEIADAFGLPQDSLELVDDDDFSSKGEHCKSCEEWARKYVELASELAECRREVERYQTQLEQRPAAGRRKRL